MVENDRNRPHVARGELTFGPYRLLIESRLLERSGESVAIGSRALDILIALAERAGETVSNRELMDRVWPNLFVEESNLRVHITSLRKILSDGQNGTRYISNIPSRGYALIAPVQFGKGDEAATKPVLRLPRKNSLPPALPHMVGRAEILASLPALVAQCRLVSVVGAGGLGKTTVAVSVAHELKQSFADAVFFIDFSVLSDPKLVASEVASVIGCRTPAEDPLAGLVAFLDTQCTLLVLDNCEHVIEAVAALADRLLCEAPNVCLLATSREALRIQGEHVHRLEPLPLPGANAGFTLEEALEAPTVRLFVERSRASGHLTSPTADDAATIVEICRRLDGIPLAIELAASRVGIYGLRTTAKLLNEHFELLWRGRRSAPPRHQTLNAMLDWSYHLLSEQERRLLARVSVFVGAFTLAAAQKVGREGDGIASVAEALAGLVDRSLITAIADADAPRFRLLDTTRAYATAKLAALGEADGIARSHAEYFADYLAGLDDHSPLFSVETASEIAAQLGNIRAALAWSFSENGDVGLATCIAAHASRVFISLAVLRECHDWCRRALEALPDMDRNSKKELMLQTGLSISAMFTSGNGEEVGAAIQRGLELAEALDEPGNQLQLLSGLHIFLTRVANFSDTLAVAERCDAIARRIALPGQAALADWMLGTSYHLVGRQNLALHYCESGMQRSVVSGVREVDMFGYDHRIRASVALARTLWLCGFPDRAAVAGRQAIEEAEQLRQPTNLCIALIYTTTIFLWRGDLDEADRNVERLMETAAQHLLAPYLAVGRAMHARILVLRGDTETGIRILQDMIATLRAERHEILLPEFWCTLTEGLVSVGRQKEAAAVVAAMEAFAAEKGDSYQDPERLRVAGETQVEIDPAAAERLFLEARLRARAQNARGWELRAVTSLAKLWSQQSCRAKARTLVSDVLETYEEGLETADLVRARALLSTLALPSTREEKSARLRAKG